MNIKKKIVILTVLITLLIGSISASAMNLNNIQKPKYTMASNEDPREIYVGEMIIDFSKDNNACDINTFEERIEATINPQGSEVTPVIFYANWSIKGHDTLQNEQWYFELTMKDGGPDGPIIDVQHTKLGDSGGGFLGPSKYRGQLFSQPIEFGRNDFSHDRLEENGVKRIVFRAELNCKYYRAPPFFDPSLLDNLTLSCATEINLANKAPTKPTLTSEDISDGGEGSVGTTYTFKASGAVDPDGDDILYYLYDFDDVGAPDNTYHAEPGEEVSHEWDEIGDIAVKVYAVDRFMALGDPATMTFTLPRSRSKAIFFDLLESFPNISRLLEILN